MASSLTTPQRVTAYVAAVTAGILGALLIRSGFLLINDSVAVPSQRLLPWMWGDSAAPPRSVPQDAIVAVLDNLIPGFLLQRLLVLAGLLLLGLGVAQLLRERPAFDQAAGASVAMLSTFVYERMLMGHWGLLLGLAALPWAMVAAADLRAGKPGSLTRLAAWTLLGSLVPSAGALLVSATALVLVWPGARHRPATTGAGILAVVSVQLVWVVPGLRNPGAGGSQAAEIFGLRAEGMAGPLLTALGTGGIWNSAVAPDSRMGLMAVIAPACLLGLAVLGVPRLGTLASPIVGPLVVISMLGLTWALLTAVPAAGPFVAAVQSIPGGGLLRDAQKWLAPWVILLSVAAGLGLGRARDRFRGTDAWWPGTVLLLLVPVLLLPDLAFGAWGRITPVAYPAEWERVRAYLTASSRPGDVVSLPWSTFRSYAWNQHRTVLDPAPRYLPRPVVTDTRLLVQRGDQLSVVPSDDPRSVLVGEALLSPAPAAALRDLGIGWVLWQEDQPATPGYPASQPGWLQAAGRTAVDGRDLDLIVLAGEARDRPERGPDVLLVVAWAGWLLILISVIVGLLRLCWSRRKGTGGIPAPGSGRLTPSD